MPFFNAIQSNSFVGFKKKQSGATGPAAPGQQAYTTAGSYTWVAPAGVTSVSVVAVGAGGGGGAGYWAGGGGGGGQSNDSKSTPGCHGGVGAVRIIWGAGRSFPSTNTGDV